jgi:hypothetical protein
MSYYVNPVPPTPQLKKFRNPPRACILLVSIPPHWKHCCYLLLIWALRLPTHHLLVPFSPACRPLSPKKKNATTDPLTDHSCHTTMTRRPPLPFGAPLLHHIPSSDPYVPLGAAGEAMTISWSDSAGSEYGEVWFSNIIASKPASAYCRVEVW